MINYNFFPSFGVCKLLVGVCSSSGLSRQEAGLMGKRQAHHPALQEVKGGSKEKDFTLRGKKTQENPGWTFKKL
jgi:hypothetical protein